MFEIRPILSALLRHKSSTLLIVLQISITFAVVVNSISIIQQRIAMMDRESGLDEKNLIGLNINSFEDESKYEQNYRQDIELLRNTPGISDALMINQIPLSGSGDSAMFSSSQENANNLIRHGAGVFSGDHHLINTMGLELIAGRNFTENEIEYTKELPKINEIIINKHLADKLYPDDSALGKSIYFWGKSAKVIGVVKTMSGSWVHDSRFHDNVIMPAVALSRFKRVLIKTEPGMRSEILRSVEKTLLDSNPNRVITYIRTLEELKAQSYQGDHAMTKILWIVISLLIIITALGIVGIVSFNVNQRTKQIGTRRALGARKIDILRHFITENILVTLIGVALGSAIAITVNIYLVDAFQLSPINWIYIPVGIITMLMTGILSVWIPARRASSLSPVIATQNI